MSVVDPMPQAEPEDILARLGNAQIFSTFDACEGFYAIPMDPDSKNYASFITHVIVTDLTIYWIIFS